MKVAHDLGKLFGFGALLLIPFLVRANMANPVINGTMGSRPFVSQFAEVIHEDLFISLDEDFKQATFRVKYHIQASKSGVQIPFLFYASEYLDDFKVTIDGVPVPIQDVPRDYTAPPEVKIKDFDYFFDTAQDNQERSFLIEDSPSGGFYVDLHDMLYFQTNISQGEHLIEVTYRATQWVDTWGWVKEYSIRYALSPAKYWKSFGSLNIQLDARKTSLPLSSNLGSPQIGNIDSIASWHFEELPVEVLQISYKPEISESAQQLINVGALGIGLIPAVFFALLHFGLVYVFRRKKAGVRFSWVAILGSLIVPFLFCIGWMYAHYFIDHFIGEEASARHGYTFMVFVFYPPIILGYGALVWIVDWISRRIG